MQNVVKHSRALVATVTFAVRDRLARLEIADNGVGFDATRGQRSDRARCGAAEQRLGMLSMAERAVRGGTWRSARGPGGPP